MTVAKLSNGESETGSHASPADLSNTGHGLSRPIAGRPDTGTQLLAVMGISQVRLSRLTARSLHVNTADASGERPIVTLRRPARTLPSTTEGACLRTSGTDCGRPTATCAQRNDEVVSDGNCGIITAKHMEEQCL